MEVRSEKERYYAEFVEISKDVPYDRYLWGEELIDKRLIVYPQKAKEIAEYKNNIKSVVNCGLVVMSFNRDDYMRFTCARFDEKNNCVYISLSAFNSCWHELKKSVDLGIRLAKERNENFALDNANDIVDLTNLDTSKRVAYMKNDRVCFKGVELSDEVKKLIGRRQSLMDNTKMKFYYASNGGFVHDKDCELVQNIPLEVFKASEEAPENMELCQKCKRRLLVRVACYPYVKQIAGCDRFFREMKFSKKRLEKAVLKEHMKFNFQSPSEFYIKCNEDSWMIDASDEANIKLFHNNYTVIDENTRCIVSGYHNQKQDGNELRYMIDYISGYTWEKHLEAKKRLEEESIEVAIEETIPETTVITDLVSSEVEMTEECTEKIITRIVRFFKRLFGLR